MKRYIIYVPEGGDWMTATVALQAFGKPQTDAKHLVTLTSESSVLEIQAKLAETVKHYVLSEVQGDIGYKVSSETMAAVNLVKQA